MAWRGTIRSMHLCPSVWVPVGWRLLVPQQVIVRQGRNLVWNPRAIPNWYWGACWLRANMYFDCCCPKQWILSRGGWEQLGFLIVTFGRLQIVELRGTTLSLLH